MHLCYVPLSVRVSVFSLAARQIEVLLLPEWLQMANGLYLYSAFSSHLDHSKRFALTHYTHIHTLVVIRRSHIHLTTPMTQHWEQFGVQYFLQGQWHVDCRGLEPLTLWSLDDRSTTWNDHHTSQSAELWLMLVLPFSREIHRLYTRSIPEWTTTGRTGSSPVS